MVEMEEQQHAPQGVSAAEAAKAQHQQCVVGISPRMRNADIAALSIATVVFIMTVVIVFVP